jgi:hypothetical protein
MNKDVPNPDQNFKRKTGFPGVPCQPILLLPNATPLFPYPVDISRNVPKESWF